MGLRCLLGHEYANREVEREREERGDEVVVTYRTVETCDRCGERRIVSENKEVRPVQRPSGETMSTGLGDDGVAPDVGEDEGADDTDTETTESPAVDPEPPAADADSVEPGDENVDDAIILDDGGEGTTEDRRHGEWPEAEGPEPPTADATNPEPTDGATVVDAGGDWPEPEGEDEGFDAEPSGSDPPAVSVGGGAAADDEGGRGAAANGTTASAAGKQFVAADEIEPVGDDGHEGATEFFCPNCGYVRTAGGSSMRAGDICPDCHEGYIGERER